MQDLDIFYSVQRRNTVVLHWPQENHLFPVKIFNYIYMKSSLNEKPVVKKLAG